MTPNNIPPNYLPPEFVLPLTWEDAIQILVDRQARVANAFNTTQNGYFESIELLNGQQFLSLIREVPRLVFRKVIDMGTLPNTGTLSIPHGIMNIVAMTHIYGTATSPTQYIPLPYAGTDAIELWVDNTNVNITTTSDRTAFTVCYVVLEYLKN